MVQQKGNTLNGKTTVERLHNALVGFKDGFDGIRGIAISSVDGLDIASEFDQEFDPTMAHAMSASVMRLASRTTKSMGLQQVQRTVLHTEDGIVLVFNIKDQIIVMVIGSSDTDINTLNTELKELCDKICAIMQI